MCSQIGRHLDDNNTLHPNQYGFRKRLSCETQLISSIQDWASSIDSKRQTDIILLDFSKAFDKVSHRKLLHKIRYYGIGGKTNSWINAFLSGRNQQVVVNGQSSQTAAVISGVPQGTVLGPMLFLLYINDIADNVDLQMRPFADDSIVYREICSPEDHRTLEQDLNKLHTWARVWQMDFNITKCAIVSVTTKKKPFIHDYLMDGQQIPRCENQDYLGVTINHKLSWKPHITKIKNKANRTLGLIRRTLHAAPQQVRKQAYEARVRPTLEYATCAWAPHTKLDIQAVEQVQRAAARYVCGDYRRRSSVTAMINRIEWDTLHTRRTLRDQTMFYKVYHGQVGISLPPSIYAADNRTRCLHEFKLRTIPANCLLYQHSFYVRCIPVWNALPMNAVTAATAKVFQSAALPVIRTL